MKLPFSESQFLAVFGQYNERFFVPIVVLWIATLVVVAFWLAGKRLGGRWISLLLCIHWVWVGFFYHFLYFARINPAARLFSILFIVQAICFGWYTVRPGKLDFYEKRPFWYPVSVALCLYSLAYPFLNLLTGFHYPQMPAFAVPCPSTLLTAGFLLSTNPPGHRLLILIPIAWTLIASSAAFLFRIYADMALPFAGIFLIVAAVRRTRKSPLTMEHSIFGTLTFSPHDGWMNPSFTAFGYTGIDLLIDAGPDGPTERQVTAFADLSIKQTSILRDALIRLQELRDEMELPPGTFRLSGITLPSYKDESQGMLWTLWFDCPEDDHFMFGVQSDDEWQTLHPFADD